MAPGSNERHPGHTGTIPKTKVRNNCNVPQEAVTPTRRDINASNLVTTSLDWVPVSEYNSRDNQLSFESGLGRFVPVRPQPRVIPVGMQHRDPSEPEDVSTAPAPYTLHPYPHNTANGAHQNVNHAPAAIMIVNPTTPNALTGNLAQPFNVPSNTNRNNLAHAYSTSRNGSEVSNSSTALQGTNNNSNSLLTNGRTSKTNNILNNMFDPAQNESSHNQQENYSRVESARALGEAMVTTCPDAAAVERRLGQIREYIRVTSSLVDTMRNSEDEEMAVRPMSVQSSGSAYSESELWQSELKAKMEVSQHRLASLQEQQRRLLKYQSEAKQQLAEIHRARQQHEGHPSSSHDNLAAAAQNQSFALGRMHVGNQVGVATTLPHSIDVNHQQHANPLIPNGVMSEGRAGPTVGEGVDHAPDDRYNAHTVATTLESRGRGAGSESTHSDARGRGPDGEGSLSERGRALTHKLRDLQLKKQHMETLVTEFQKLQAATLGPRAPGPAGPRNTYSSSGDESLDEDAQRKCNKTDNNLKNDDPFKLMEITAIKAALQKTKDLMRTVELYENHELAGSNEDNYQLPAHSNIHDNKSEGGRSGRSGGSGWSGDSVCRVRNSLHQHKLTNEHHNATHYGHETSIASLQALAAQLRQEADNVATERTRLKHAIARKESGKLQQKKVNEPTSDLSGVSVAPGPVERRQMELHADLVDKQRQLQALLNMEKDLTAIESNKTKVEQHGSAASRSYNSEQEDPDSRADQVLLEAQTALDHYRNTIVFVDGPRNSHHGSTYCSDSDSASRSKSGRARMRRAQRQATAERQTEDNISVRGESSRAEARVESAPVTAAPHHGAHTDETSSSSTPYPNAMPLLAPGAPPAWLKPSPDTRNHFTHNTHSQTGAPSPAPAPASTLPLPPFHAHAPPTPFNMMLPYGMIGGMGGIGGAGAACGGCGWWAAWCWQELAAHQRQIQQLREQVNHLEERWRSAEVAPHALNNQVPPGNRANNYWDNFRSYSRQNLLSANSKTNADGHLGTVQPHNPHPLTERSHNALHPAARPQPAPRTPPNNTPKRNTNQPSNIDESTRQARRNYPHDRANSYTSAPDVLNLNQNLDSELSNVPVNARNFDDPPVNAFSNINLNREDHIAERNLNFTNQIPEIIQSHSNLNSASSSFHNKKKSSTKLPAKNSANRRNYSLDYVQNSNIDIAGTSETPNPNLAPTAQDVQDKATSKLFDLLRENVYSEVTALISANESHPDFLIQLFRELQQISSDALRQHALQSIREVLSHSNLENHVIESHMPNGHHNEAISSTSSDVIVNLENVSTITERLNTISIDNNVINFMLGKSEEICTPYMLHTLKNLIMNAMDDCGQTTSHMKKKLHEYLAKYEGVRLGDVSSDIIENLPTVSELEEPLQTSEPSDTSVLQDVAGALNLFNSSETHIQQEACSYDSWTAHVEGGVGDMSEGSQQESCRFNEAKVDLIDCSEMYNGDLAEADQTCHSDAGEQAAVHEAAVEALPDVVETEETTPTEAEAGWIGLDRVPTRLPYEDNSKNQKDH